jgi:hypothetical protein
MPPTSAIKAKPIKVDCQLGELLLPLVVGELALIDAPRVGWTEVLD